MFLCGLFVCVCVCDLSPDGPTYLGAGEAGAEVLHRVEVGDVNAAGVGPGGGLVILLHVPVGGGGGGLVIH